MLHLTAASVVLVSFAQAAAPDVSPTGEELAEACASCHALASDAKQRWGPSLVGLRDRPVGSEAGYRYGSYLRARRDEGAVWDEQALRSWLVDSKGLAKAAGARTKMPSQDTDEAVLDRLIAYLWTLE